MATIVTVDRTDQGCRVSCSKQKDSSVFDPFSLKFQSVQYGPAASDASVVLVRDTEDTQPALRQSESVMLALLEKAERALTYGEWVKAGMEVGLSESTACKAIKVLLQSSRVVKKGKRYLLDREEVHEEAEQLSWDEASDD